MSTLKIGTEFCASIPTTATSIIFTDIAAPDNVTITDISTEQDGGIISWLNGTTYYVSTQVEGTKVVANPSCEGMFRAKTQLTSIDLANIDTSNVTTMQSMFHQCGGLTELDVSMFDTSNVTTMRSMFNSCSGLRELDLSTFDVSNVESMRMMFGRPSSWTTPMSLTKINITGWNTAKLTEVRSMFQLCDSLYDIDLTILDMSKVTDFYNLLRGCSFTNLDLTMWDVSNVTSLYSCFSECKKLENLDISNWNTSKVIDMSYAFDTCTSLTSLDLSNWNLNNVQCFIQTFHACKKIKHISGIENFNTSNCYDFQYMFYDCNDLQELDLSNFDTTKAKDNLPLPNDSNNTSKCMAKMILNMSNIKKITLGDKFSFNGDGTTTSNTTTFPTPTFTEFDGYWYNENGEAFAPNKIPNKTAGTYYAINPETQVKINYQTMIDMGESFRKNMSTPNSLSPSEMVDAVEDVYENGREVGHKEGIQDGYTEGYTDGNSAGYDNGYDKGYTDGDKDGHAAGFAIGYDNGLYEGTESGRAEINDIYDKMLSMQYSVDSTFTNDRITTLNCLCFNNSKYAEINLPNVQSVCDGAFYLCGYGGRTKVFLPKATTLGDSVFMSASISHLDVSSATNIKSTTFQQFYSIKELFLKPLGITTSFTLSNSNMLSGDSIQNVIDALADLTGQTAKKVTFHSTIKNKLTDEQLAQISSKNWTLG